MPGSFSLDNALPPIVDTSVGAKCHIFQPPYSASSSLYGSTASLLSPLQHVGDTRNSKRARHDSHLADQATPLSTPSHASSGMSYDPPSSFPTSPLESPPPLANVDYRLAGGLDTPTARAALAIEGRMLQDKVRRVPGGRGIRDYDPIQSDGYFPQTPSVLTHERNGQPRLPKSPNIRDGLGNVIYRFAGVAGKVLGNWTSAIRGFYAGGGQGYEMKPPAQTGLGTPWPGAGQDGFWSMDGGDIPPTPGGFPQEDYIHEYMSQDHYTTPRAAKRNKRDRVAGDAIAGWVMVGSTTSSRENSPSRLSHRKVPPSSSATKRIAPKLGRRPILPASRPSRSSFASSPGLRSERASFTSPRSPNARSPKPQSPVSVEVQRHAVRLRKKEAEEDANLKRFNQQLKAMIREGKEALGTRFEVEED
ncbi:MAG: hypothetical protein Q9217_000544 [Psora testacea]